MDAFYTDVFVLPLPEGHRFPMAKYRLLRERVEAAGRCRLVLPPAATDAELLRVHDRGYLERLQSGTLDRMDVRRLGFPWSPELVERARRSVGGTVAACRSALERGVAANLAGGTHHAFADRPEGFCVFNDAVVALRTMQAEGRIARGLVVDTDVHQGNGTAALAAGDPTVYAFSIHGAGNFPFRKESSDLDVALADGTGDDEYLDHLDRSLRRALDESRPELAVFVSGADPYEDDRLGRLSLTKGGLAARDRLVLETLLDAGVPVAVTMAGGYARLVEDTVDIHATTIDVASSFV